MILHFLLNLIYSMTQENTHSQGHTKHREGEYVKRCTVGLHLITVKYCVTILFSLCRVIEDTIWVCVDRQNQYRYYSTAGPVYILQYL